MSIEHARQGRARYTELICCFGNGQAQSGQDVVPQQETRVGWIVHWAHGVHPGSVIVQVIDQDGVTILESKNQSPVPADPHGEASLQGSVKWVQFPSRYIHVVWGLRGIQASQLPCDLGGMVRLNPCLATRFIESLQALVAETFDHAALCIVTPRRSTARMASRFWRIPRSI